MKKTNNILTFFAAILILLAIAFGSQGQTRDSVGTVSHDTTYLKPFTEKVSHDSVFKVAVMPPTNTTWRGVYQSGLSSISTSETAKLKLIASANKYNINAIFFYSIDGANDAGTSDLFKRLRKSTKIDEIGATASSSSTFINTRLKWNAQHSDSADYNTFNYEYEPWRAVANGSTVAIDWSKNVSYLQATDKATATLPIQVIDYFGWWNDAPMTTQTPDTLVKYCDYIILHNYRVKPEFGYMRTRCNDLEAAAKRQNVVKKLRVIISAEPSFLQPWLKQGHTVEECYLLIKKDFDAMNYKNIVMDGYLVFTLDFLNASQPASAVSRGSYSPIDPNFKNIDLHKVE